MMLQQVASAELKHHLRLWINVFNYPFSIFNYSAQLWSKAKTGFFYLIKKHIFISQYDIIPSVNNKQKKLIQ